VKRISSLLAVATIVACSDAFKPTIDNVSGMYSAQTFTSDSAGTTKNWITAGATLDLALTPGGVVTGQLVMPGVPSDTTTFVALLDGTWSLTGKTVRFTQGADTFIRDVDWVVGENRLSGDETFGGVRVRVVLTKQ